MDTNTLAERYELKLVYYSLKYISKSPHVRHGDILVLCSKDSVTMKVLFHKPSYLCGVL